MRRLSLVTVLACLAVAPAAADAAQVRLTPTGGAKFPARSYVLTLPAGSTVGTGAVDVTENGQPVNGLRVIPATRSFAVVLAIDTSESMRGHAIQGALDAARAFAAQRPADQPLGIVLFNSSTKVLLPPTTDAVAIDQALATTPELAPDTHIYDGALTALKLLGGRYTAGAVVVLSDGHDYGSTVSPAEVARTASQRHGRIFSVGLRSAQFDPSTLEEISGTAHGEYLGAAASSEELKQVYQRLGGELSSSYLLRWRSLRPAGTSVHVRATLPGGVATDGYSAPRLALPSGSGASTTHRSIVRTGAFAALMALVAATLLLGLILLLLRRNDRHTAVRRRISGYGLESEVEDFILDPEKPARRRLGGARTERLARALELGEIALTPAQFVAWVFAAAFATALVLASIGGAIFALLGFALVVVFARAYVRRSIAARRRQFADQLADAVQAAASAMRTGHSFVSALAQVVESSPEPMSSELRRVVADERLGVPLETAFQEAVQRMDNSDLHQVALVSVLQREAGGNGAEALDRVVENLRARDDVRRLVTTLSSQGRLSGRVLVALPIICVVLLTIINPRQMHPLYHSFVGHLAIAVAALMMLAANGWIRKIVDIRV